MANDNNASGYGHVSDDSVIVVHPSPPGKGYGFGYSPYGGALYPKVPFPPEHGYGAEGFGTGPYGHADKQAPKIASAVPLDGYWLRVYFDEPVFAAELKEAAKWVIEADFGYNPIVNAFREPRGFKGTDPETGGEATLVTSIDLKHSGTVLGDRYRITCEEGTTGFFRDQACNRTYAPYNEASFIGLSSKLQYSISVNDESDLVVLFDTPMGVGLDDTASFVIENPSDYPVSPVIQSATPIDANGKLTSLDVPELSRPKRAILKTHGLTSLDYDLIAGPAESILYDPENGLPSTGATEMGTGESVVQAAMANANPAMLLLNKPAGAPYGWHFTETDTSRFGSDSVFRMDFAMAAHLAVWKPEPMDGNVMGVHVCDGDVQVSLLFGRVTGSDFLTIYSGGTNISVPCAWSLSNSVVSLVRNPLIGLWTVLHNGTPLITFALADLNGAPSMEAGLQFVIASAVEVSNMCVVGLSLTASKSLYTGIGNFVHEISHSFHGTDHLTMPSLRTKRGPLTKGWGDSRPATSEDVEVRVNGVEVAVKNVNPYLGEVYTEVPIPRMPKGEMSVEVDYKWFPTARMEMASLNTMGLVLNKWDIRSGRDSSSDALKGVGGSKEGERFPMCLSLGKAPEWNPKWISHRHIGFDRAYTAALNEPTSLVLNANPHLYAPPRTTLEFGLLDGRYEGEEDYSDWVRSGAVLEPVARGMGYTALKTKTWGYVYQWTPMALSPGVVSIAARTIAPPLPDSPGVTVGPCLVSHDNDRLKCVAALRLGDLEHFGILEGEDPNDESSWKIGPASYSSFASQSHIVVPAGELPQLFDVGGRLQIRKGSQAGVYVCTSVESLSDGSTQLGIYPPLPTDIDTWEADAATVLFDASWSTGPFTWGMEAVSNGPGIELSFSGAVAATLSTPVEGPPIDSIPDLKDTEHGQVVWGHPLTWSDYRSAWSFVRYAVTPHERLRSSGGHLTSAELQKLPEEEGGWWRTSPLGDAKPNGDGTITLRAEAFSTDLSDAAAYGRVDPLIPASSTVEVQGRFKVQGAGCGWGDAGFTVKGPTRDVRLVALLYANNGQSNQLLSMPVVSLTGTRFGSIYWDQSSMGSLGIRNEGRVVRLTGDGTGSGSITRDLRLVAPFRNGVNRLMEARLSLQSNSDAVEDVGVAFSMSAGPDGRFVALSFLNAPRRVALSSGEGHLVEVECDWTQEHTYQVIAEHSTEPHVTLSIDGENKGSASLLDFRSGGNLRTVGVQSYGTNPWEMELSALSVSVLPPRKARRTLGIYKGGPAHSIDSYVIPRDDIWKDSIRNSNKMSSFIEMDWRQWTHVRLTVDPTWGVSLLRPDLPLPPAFDETGRATEWTNPTAAWATLEWGDVPLHQHPHSRFSFGSLNAASMATVDWDYFKYRVFIGQDEGKATLRGAVLNRWNLVTSGELGQDLTVDEAHITMDEEGHASLREAHINANRIFSVAVGQMVLPRTRWSFNKAEQKLTVDRPDDSLGNALVVKFSPGTPVTSTYLEKQPLHDGVTNLNEGTPPMSWTRSRPWLRGYLPASRINEVSDTLNIDADFVLNDPLGSVTFGNHPADLYADVSFMEIEDHEPTGRISTADDGPAPGKGFAGLELEGRMVHDRAWETLRPDFDHGGGAMGSLLHLAGGVHQHTGVIGGGKAQQGAPMWPSQPALPTKPNQGAAERQARWDIREAREETIDQPSTSGSYVMEHGGPYSRVGPWGGLESLESHSLLYGGPASSGTVGMVLQGGSTLPPPGWSFGDLPD